MVLAIPSQDKHHTSATNLSLACLMSISSSNRVEASMQTRSYIGSVLYHVYTLATKQLLVE